MTDPPERDQHALELRSAASSLARVATDLGYGRRAHAMEAFNFARRRARESRRTQLRSPELAGRDALADKVRAVGRDKGELARRLATVEHLRTRLLAP